MTHCIKESGFCTEEELIEKYNVVHDRVCILNNIKHVPLNPNSGLKNHHSIMERLWLLNRNYDRTIYASKSFAWSDIVYSNMVRTKRKAHQDSSRTANFFEKGINTDNLPYELMEGMSLPGNVIHDFCSGTGSMSNVCMAHGRISMAFEKDDDQFAMCINFAEDLKDQLKATLAVRQDLLASKERIKEKALLAKRQANQDKLAGKKKKKKTMLEFLDTPTVVQSPATRPMVIVHPENAHFTNLPDDSLITIDSGDDTDSSVEGMYS